VATPRDRPSGPFSAHGMAARRTRSHLTPFQRLARPHALMAAGDAVMFVALAGSLFLSIDLSTARTKVLLFLAVSVAPFAIVAPLIGPVIDRMVGGRKLVVQAAAVLRALVALFMMAHIDSLLLFPEVFAALVLSKTYAVSKSALVPAVVANEEELVEANSKLGIIAGVVGGIAVIPAAILQKISPSATLLFDAMIFGLAFLTARGLPREAVATQRAGVQERTELRSSVIVMAASAMVLLRASVGFLFFLLAFWLRGQSAGTVWFAISLVLAAIGTMVGNAIGPGLRRAVREELMLIVALGLTSVGGIMAAILGSEAAGAALALIVNTAAAIGKLGFDSIVQRNAPDANHGRAFAQFESRFQLAWVLAAIPPVLLTPPGWLGFAIVGAIAGLGMATYLVSMRRLHLGKPLPEGITGRARREVRRRIDRRRKRPRRASTSPGDDPRRLPNPPPDARAQPPPSPAEPPGYGPPDRRTGQR
jgi:hypothetical protein